MIKRITYLIVFAISMSLWSCSEKAQQGEAALELLVYHYEHEDVNPLKVEMVRYFAENIRWHYTFKGEVTTADIESITYDFLREHIDYIYNVWQTSPYSKDLNFEDFKKYLLPYNACPGIGPNLTAKERGEWMAAQGLSSDLMSETEMIKKYNEIVSALRQSKKHSGQTYRSGLDDLSDTIFSDCADKAHHCIQNLRSIGIPCIAERNWCYRQLIAHHVHCAIYNPKENTFYRFNAEDTTSVPDSAGWNFVEMQNLCRLTYARQLATPYYLKQSCEKPVYPFTSPCIKDVTRRSYRTKIYIDTDKSHNLVYLACFNRDQNGFAPVTWGLVDSTHTTATFNNALPSTLYFPGISDNGSFKPKGQPIYFDVEGDSLVCHPAEFAVGHNSGKKERIVVRRKYPVKEATLETINQLKGCRIEASDTKDFSRVKVIGRLSDPLLPNRQIIKIDNCRPYKFYRFVSANKAEIKVSILRWIDGNGTAHKGETSNPAYDESMTTSPENVTQIAIEFASPTTVEAIEIAPLNADNGVTAGHSYQLYYYDVSSGLWIALATTTAVTDEIVFNNVPSDCLLWLSDRTTGREEMPFVYQNNKQLFLYPDLIAPLP